MEQSSNNKALACFILYGAPLVLLAKHGWQLGILMCLLFLGSYSFLPYIKNIRSNVRTLDKHVFVSYIVVIDYLQQLICFLNLITGKLLPF